MKNIIIVLMLLIPTTGWSFDKWDTTDKVLMGSVITLQIIDGLSTNYLLGEGAVVSDTWRWKYGTERPSSGHLWAVKTVEVIGAYYVGDKLPSSIRKVFLFCISGILYSCIRNNLQGRYIGFSITY